MTADDDRARVPGEVRPGPDPDGGDLTDEEYATYEAAITAQRVPGEVGDEQSVNLTPGVVWTDSQLVVVRDLAARVHRAEGKRVALVEALEGLHQRQAGTWGYVCSSCLGSDEENLSWPCPTAAVLEAHR